MKKTFLLLFSLFFLQISCTDKNSPTENVSTAEDLSKYITGEGIMMQAFYWDVEPRGEWWNTISGKLDTWNKIGVDKIWIPPMSKGQSGGYSMGYDPMDYFDFGEYDQMGTTETRFGSRTELENLISKAHSNKMKVIADIVLNHNSGGSLEYNPFRQKNTYTLFNPKSGKFLRNYNCYHPNSIHNNDREALFFAEQDLCHDQLDVQNWFWKDANSVAKYYKNTLKIDGWRFDYVKGFDPWVVKAWLDEVGGYAVSEFWDGDATALEKYVNASTSPVFDFAAFYALEQAIDGNNMNILKDRDMMIKRNATKAITFVTNHDTEKDTNQGNRIGSSENKLLAYAYIFTHEGTPCLFYLDYESFLDKTKVEKLIQINRSLAKGSTGVLYADLEGYIAQRSGDDKVPGLVVFINNGNIAKSQSVVTKWKNATLYDYSGNITKTLKTDANGRVNLEASAKGYSIWSLKKFN